MKQKIEWSNLQAIKNCNLYPIQEQATLKELWEYVPCTCDSGCTCKRFGCTHHWKLKKNIDYDEFVIGLLRMFVNRNQHNPVINSLKGTHLKKLNTRAEGAFEVLKSLKNTWTQISNEASRYNKTLFCDDWLENDVLKARWAFPTKGTTIYEAKQNCILFPDICVPYDTKSLEKLNKAFKIRGADYFELLKTLRQHFLKCMEDNHFNIPTMRILESPQSVLPFNRNLISLSRQDFDYGPDYSPERPISIIIDKCYYQPRSHPDE